MAVMIDLSIAGRTYQVACREGEEDSLRTAARLVDGKSREALAGLGTLSEARQFLFASLLLADQLIDDQPDRVAAETAPAPPTAAQEPARPDPALILRAEAIADHLESLATTLEKQGSNA
jgi:cell division protein ZapA